MQNAAILNDGLTLMLFGMGTVFLFLALLVLSTKMMSATVLRFGPEPVPGPIATGAAEERQAAIAAALHHHRNRS